MLNRLARLAMSTSVLIDLPGKLDIKRHSPCILFLKDGIRLSESVLSYQTIRVNNTQTNVLSVFYEYKMALIMT